ncbi:MAG: HAD family phosphatase [Candidatus Sulfotelmatobacter sp.]
MSKVESVIFDMDGVIIDSHPAHRKAWHEFLQSLDKDVPDEELDFIVDGRKRSEILRHFLGDMPESMLAEYGRMKDKLFQGMAFEVKPVPGVIEFVGDLMRCGIKLGVATSASKSRTLSTFRHLHLTGCFATVVTGDDVPDGKSSPAIYELVCAHLRTRARDSLVLEDSASAIRAAKEAGFRCIGVGSGCSAKLQEAGADHVIKDFVGFSLDALELGSQP